MDLSEGGERNRFFSGFQGILLLSGYTGLTILFAIATDHAARSGMMEKTLKASAAYDFITCFPFAIPGLADLYVWLWRSIHVAMHLEGPFPSFEPFHMLFLNLFGILATIWAIVRWMSPGSFLLRADVCARAAIGVLMTFYAVSGSTSRIVILFIPAEFLFLILLARLWGKRENMG